jgi:hypothetical protein
MKLQGRTGVVAIITGVVLAFAVGSLGTASAAGLTKGAVKKIAAKVVKKNAPSLSVAHATSADSATVAATLQGSTADQLKTHSYTYVLPAQAATSAHVYTFPGLPIGTYFVSYSYHAQVQGAGAEMACQVEAAAGSFPEVAVSYGVGATGLNRGSSSGVLTTTPTTAMTCSMQAGTSYNFVASTAVDDSVTFIPIDVATRTNANSTRAVPSAAAGRDVTRSGTDVR